MIRRIPAALAVVVGLLVMSVLTPTQLFPESQISEKRQVLLIDHGTHSSLALETNEGGLIRFAYGDLRYYANRDTSLESGAAALLWPTPATLGRAELAGPPTAQNLKSQLVVVVDTIYSIEAEAAAVDELIAKLDQIHSSGEAQHVAVPAYGFVFAPHPDDYFWANNSSTMIADWLRELGVSTFGWGLLASWWVAGT